MATVADYASGKIIETAKKAFAVLATTQGTLEGTPLGDRLLNGIREMAPYIANMENAAALIGGARRQAVGTRMCHVLDEQSDYTEAVFLDELADALVQSGKARHVTKDEALEILSRYPKHPIVISRVSGKYSEICRSCPQTCLGWNIEKHGLKCFRRQSEPEKGV